MARIEHGGPLGWYYDKIKDELGDYTDYLGGIRDKEGIMSMIGTGAHDVKTLGKNVATTIPDWLIGSPSKLLTRSLGYEYTPMDPGGYAQKFRENEVSPFGIQGLLPWMYSKLGGIPKYTYKGDEVSGIGSATKLLAGSGIEGLMGKEGPYTESMDKMQNRADELMEYYIGFDDPEKVEEWLPEGFKEYEKGNWTSAGTKKLEREYGDQFDQEKVWEDFLDDVQKASDEGYDEYAAGAYSNPQEFFNSFKEWSKTNWIEGKKLNQLMPGYLKESGDKYRKSLIDEYGMYPLFSGEEGGKVGEMSIWGNKFFTADPKWVNKEKKEGKMDHQMFPGDFDLGVFEPFAKTDWAPYSYSSDVAGELFEHPGVRLPAELPAMIYSGPGAVSRVASTVLPKSLQWSAKQAMPLTFGHASRARRWGQAPALIAANAYYDERGDEFIRKDKRW